MRRNSPLKDTCILVVDDELELRQGIARIFKRYGCRVLQADSGRAALEILPCEAVDVVISDIRMPNGSGEELLRGLMSMGLPTVPIVVLMTGFSDLQEEDALKMGAYAILEKPINKRKMIGIVESWCDLFKKAA